jgi:hypothetical protein
MAHAFVKRLRPPHARNEHDDDKPPKTLRHGIPQWVAARVHDDRKVSIGIMTQVYGTQRRETMEKSAINIIQMQRLQHIVTLQASRT